MTDRETLEQRLREALLQASARHELARIGSKEAAYFMGVRDGFDSALCTLAALPAEALTDEPLSDYGCDGSEACACQACSVQRTQERLERRQLEREIANLKTARLALAVDDERLGIEVDPRTGRRQLPASAEPPPSPPTDSLRQWVIDNIYTMARREQRRGSEGKPLRSEMWEHVIQLCEQAGAGERIVGVLRETEPEEPR